jgi:SM-20-related protein
MTRTTILLQEGDYGQVAFDIAERGYSIIDDFLSSEEVTSILKTIRQEELAGTFNPAGIGQGNNLQQNQGIRRDYIHWIDHEAPPASCIPYFERLQTLIRYLNRACYLGIRDIEMHFALYQPGGFYKRHLDVFQRARSRKLSAICYLNAEWTPADGGALKLYLPNSEGEEVVTVDPIAGRLMLFESHTIEHEVEMAYHERCSITGWLKDEAQPF